MTYRGRSASEWMERLGHTGPESDSPEQSNDTETIERLVRLIESPTPKPRVRFAPVIMSVGVGLAAAAGALFYWTLPAPKAEPALARVISFGGATLINGQVSSAREERNVLRSGDSVESDRPFRLRFESGEDVSADAGTLFTARGEEASHSLFLTRGGVHLRVPKKKAGTTFEVMTSSTTVTVVGTEFRVWLASSSKANVTCVSVSEGRVRARTGSREIVLNPGDTFASSGSLASCFPELSSETEEQAPPDTSDDSISTRTLRRPGPVDGGKKTERSSLADENARFLKVVKAEREGRKEEAAQLRAEFLTLYPNSPFAPRLRASSSEPLRK